MKILFRYFAAVLSALSLFSCVEKPVDQLPAQLEAPQLEVVSQDATSFVVSWAAVEHADSYTYVYNGGEETATDLTILSYENLMGGSHTIKVKATSVQGIEDSEWAEITIDIDAITLSFEIVDLTPVSARVIATPSDNDSWYFFNLFPAERFQGSDAEIVAAIMADLQSQCDAVGISLKEGMEQIRNKGVDEWLAGSMTPEHEYVVYGFGLDEDGNPASVLFTEKFTTPAAPANIIQLGEINESDYTFSINTGEYMHAFVPVKKGLFDLGGYSEEDYLQIFGIISAGNQTYHWVNGQELVPGYVMEVSPNTDYIILASVCHVTESGARSYGPVERVDFTTPAKATMDGAAEITVTDITASSASIDVKIADGVSKYVLFWRDKGFHDMALSYGGEGLLISTIKTAVDSGLAKEYTENVVVEATGLTAGTEYYAYVLAYGVDGTETLVYTPFTTL